MKFGMVCLMQLGKIWGTNTINETTDKLSVLDSASDGNPSFELIQVITDLVTAAIITDKSNNLEKFDSDDIPDVVFNDGKLLQEIFVEFMSCLPHPEGKKIPTSKKQVGTK